MKSKHKRPISSNISLSRFKVILGIFFLTALAVSVKNTSFFLAKKIECYTQFGTCSTAYVSQVEWLKGRSMFSRLPSTQVKKQFSSFPEIQSVSLFRRLPSTLVVSMTLRKPLGALGPNVLGAQAISDENGQVYKQIDESDLPLIFTNTPPAINVTLTPNQIKGLKILENLSSLSDYRLTASLSGSSLFVNFLPNLEVIVDVNNNLADWYPSLQLILTRSKITAKMPHKIDLRFDNSVIVN